MICPKCDGLVGRTNGSGDFLCEVWGGAVPICVDDNGSVRTIGYTIVCPCEYTWDWKPKVGKGDDLW